MADASSSCFVFSSCFFPDKFTYIFSLLSDFRALSGVDRINPVYCLFWKQLPKTIEPHYRDAVLLHLKYLGIFVPEKQA